MVEGGLAALLQKKLADVDRSPEGKLSLVDSFCGSALPSIREQLLHRNVQRFRGGFVFKARSP